MTKIFFPECFRLLDTFQHPGNNSPRVRHENLERLQKKIDQKASLGRKLRPKPHRSLSFFIFFEDIIVGAPQPALK